MIDYNTIAETKNFIVLDRYLQDSIVAEDYQSEDALEREFIRDLVNQGYNYEVDIRSPKAMLTNVRVQLEELNEVRFTEDEWKRFVEQYLDPASENSTDKARKLHEDIHDFVFDDGHIENIYLLDKKNVLNNKLQVIKQFE
jgi:type I restriction enzyme R subunit